MMPRLPSRSALLVPVLGLGLLVPGFNANLTRADTLPAPCELATVGAPAGAAEDDLLLLRSILPADLDPALAAAAPRPPQGAPALPDVVLPPVAPRPPGALGVPKPTITDLRPPDPALLNLEPIVAARQLRESLTEKQKADLSGVLTKHQDALQQARGRLPQLAADPVGNRPARADREAAPNQAAADVQRISDQIDQEIELNLTPAQRALLEKSRPKRLRAELPGPSEVVAAESAPGC